MPRSRPQVSCYQPPAKGRPQSRPRATTTAPRVGPAGCRPPCPAKAMHPGAVGRAGATRCRFPGPQNEKPQSPTSGLRGCSIFSQAIAVSTKPLGCQPRKCTRNCQHNKVNVNRVTGSILAKGPPHARFGRPPGSFSSPPTPPARQSRLYRAARYRSRQGADTADGTWVRSGIGPRGDPGARAPASRGVRPQTAVISCVWATAEPRGSFS